MLERLAVSDLSYCAVLVDMHVQSVRSQELVLVCTVSATKRKGREGEGEGEGCEPRKKCVLCI